MGHVPVNLPKPGCQAAVELNRDVCGAWRGVCASEGQASAVLMTVTVSLGPGLDAAGAQR